jgi:hypothetical protein
MASISDKIKDLLINKKVGIIPSGEEIIELKILNEDYQFFSADKSTFPIEKSKQANDNIKINAKSVKLKVFVSDYDAIPDSIKKRVGFDLGINIGALGSLLTQFDFLDRNITATLKALQDVFLNRKLCSLRLSTLDEDLLNMVILKGSFSSDSSGGGKQFVLNLELEEFQKFQLTFTDNKATALTQDKNSANKNKLKKPTKQENVNNAKENIQTGDMTRILPNF